MSEAEVSYLALVIGTMTVFALALAWASRGSRGARSS